MHNSRAQCVSGLRGKLLCSYLHHCSRNADYWGYSAGAFKTINEQESALIENNQRLGGVDVHGAQNAIVRNNLDCRD